MIRRIDAADDPRWPTACAHVARALRGVGATVAHYDDASLVATLRDGFEPFIHACEELINSDASDPLWAVGLEREGYSYQVLRTGPEALDALRALKVGSTKPLILLDLDLPGLDGHAIHERLRVERPRDFVVVFVSVHGGDADQVRALRAGATDYITKPVSLRVLMAKLPRWARQPRSQR